MMKASIQPDLTAKRCPAKERNELCCAFLLHQVRAVFLRAVSLLDADTTVYDCNSSQRLALGVAMGLRVVSTIYNWNVSASPSGLRKVHADWLSQKGYISEADRDAFLQVHSCIHKRCLAVASHPTCIPTWIGFHALKYRLILPCSECCRDVS